MVGALTRARWAAVGAAVAVTLGLAGLGTVQLVGAQVSSGERSVFVPLTPARILDTRSGIGGVTGPIVSGGSFEMQVAGQGGVPADATGVVMNVTATMTTAAGYITIWPAGEAQPTTSNLNLTAGQDIPNLVTVKLGTNGRLGVFNFGGATQIVADVAGYYVDHNHDDRYVKRDDLTNFGVVRWARVQLSGTSASIYQENEKTEFDAMSVVRTAEGVYEVTVPGVTANGGYYSVFVSAEQGQTTVFRACKVFQNVADPAGSLVVRVRCYDAAAALSESSFSILVLH